MSNEMRTLGLEMRKRALVEHGQADAQQAACGEGDAVPRRVRRAVAGTPPRIQWRDLGATRTKMRRTINVSLLSALIRSHEFKRHAHRTLNSGVTKQEITETLLQVMIHCGVPVGVKAIRRAREEFDVESVDRCPRQLAT